MAGIFSGDGSNRFKPASTTPNAGLWDKWKTSKWQTADGGFDYEKLGDWSVHRGGDPEGLQAQQDYMDSGAHAAYTWKNNRRMEGMPGQNLSTNGVAAYGSSVPVDPRSAAAAALNGPAPSPAVNSQLAQTVQSRAVSQPSNGMVDTADMRQGTDGVYRNSSGQSFDTPAVSTGNGTEDAKARIKAIQWGSDPRAATQQVKAIMASSGLSSSEVGEIFGFTGDQINSHFAKYDGSVVPAAGARPAWLDKAEAHMNAPQAPNLYEGSDGPSAPTSWRDPETNLEYSRHSVSESVGSDKVKHIYRSTDATGASEFTQPSQWNGRAYKEYDDKGQETGKGVWEGLSSDSDDLKDLAKMAAVMGTVYFGGTALAAGGGGSGTAAVAAAGAEEAAAMAASSAGMSGAGGAATTAAGGAGLTAQAAVEAATKVAISESVALGLPLTAQAAVEAATKTALATAATTGGGAAGIKAAITTALSGLGLSVKDVAAIAGAVLAATGSGGGGGGGSGSSSSSGSTNVGAGKSQGKEAADFLKEVTPYLRNDSSNSYGSNQWTQDANGKWTLKQTLNPEQQGIFDNTTRGLSQASNLDPNEKMKPLLDDAGGKYSQDLADKIYARTARNFLPEMQAQRTKLETRLAERGMQPGTQAYVSEMNRFDKQFDDQIKDAASQAQIQAATQALQEGEFTNNSRRNEFSGNQTARNAAIATLSGMRDGVTKGASGMTNTTSAPTGVAPNGFDQAQTMLANQQARDDRASSRKNDLYQALLQWGLSS